MSDTAPIRTFTDPRVGRQTDGQECRATVLDELRSELASELAKADVTFAHPEAARAAYRVRYSTDIDHGLVQAWRRRAVSNGEVDELHLAATVLASQCRGISRQGEDLTDPEGQPLTFLSPAFHDLVGAIESTAAVRRFYGRDAHVLSTATALYAAAGYGEQVRPDPTAG